MTTPSAAPTSGTVRVRNTRDALGRVTLYQEYQFNGTTVEYSRSSTYNVKSEVTDDVVTRIDANGSDTWSYTTHYDFNLETVLNNNNWTGAYLGGVVTHQLQTVRKNGTIQASLGNETRNTYVWWGGAQQSVTKFTPNTTVPGTFNTSTYNYDTSGHLTTVGIVDGHSRTVSYVTDSYGQVMSRFEQNQNGAGNPRDIYYYFDGLRTGQISNNGTDNIDYAAALSLRYNPVTNGNFRNGATGYSPYADFDQSYDAINLSSSGEAGTASHYTVMDGDTLQSIASQLWGDSSYWYMIADANGLNGTESLQAGTSLVIPNTVHNAHNSSSTFRVYDPNQAIGDTSPTAPKPPKKGGGGAMGMILLIAIAVAVTVVTAGAAAAAAAPGLTLGQGITVALGGVAGGVSATTAGLATFGAIGAVAGSVVSQAVGVATGLQDKFSWKGVALAGLSGGIGGGLGGLISGGGILAGAARGIAGSVLTQGVAVATGLQHKFDWAGVAAAGAAGGVGGWMGQHVDIPSRIGTSLVTGMARGIAGAASRSLITGTDFGDNLEAVLPDVLGQTIGDAVASRIAGVSKGSEAGRPVQTAANEARDAMGRPINAQSDFGEIVVTARKVGDQAAAKGRGLLDWFDGIFDTNLGGHNPHTKPANAAPRMELIWTNPRASSPYSQGERLNFEMQRLTSGTISGIAYGLSGQFGASPATRDLVSGLGTSLDGVALGFAMTPRGGITLPTPNNGAPLISQQYWPSNRGFLYSTQQTLPTGTLMDRYGSERGTFAAPYGTPLETRALDYGAATRPYRTYETLQPLSVRVGPAAPWFGQPGMGTQYELPASIETLMMLQQIRRK